MARVGGGAREHRVLQRLEQTVFAFRDRGELVLEGSPWSSTSCSAIASSTRYEHSR